MLGSRSAALAAAALFTATAMACTMERRTDQNVQALPSTAHYREVIQPEGAPRLPMFSSAIRNGNLLYLSGQLGAKWGTTELVEGGVGPETRQTFENMKKVLQAAGLGLENVLKCTVFLADMADYAAMNEVYQSYFTDIVPPARSAMAGSGLALGARVEIECIAAYPQGR